MRFLYARVRKGSILPRSDCPKGSTNTEKQKAMQKKNKRAYLCRPQKTGWVTGKLEM